MINQFGSFNGSDVKAITLKGGGLTATVLNWGAVLQDLRLEGHDAPLVLGFQKFDDYIAHSPYFGASVGRFANRIQKGQFEIDGKTFQVDQNETSGNSLHGGASGISNQLWQIEDYDESSVLLTVIDEGSVTGYPGNCKISCLYSLKPKGVFEVVYTCETDQATPANIAHHSYFNLDGSENIFDHEIMIKADGYLPVSDALIPHGDVRDVTSTDFDFRAMRSIKSANGFVEYDHNFCLSDAQTDCRHVATLKSRKSGVEMVVNSTEPGIQFYTGFGISPTANGLSGAPYQRGAGLCLETQAWPDAPNQPTFPNSILKPDEQLVQRTEYIFTKK
ncbi:MAG: galactose mutarotase [Rhizobiaceae bacterium]|nr:galactose mutarotase [Rhizobiaceae bacterium]